MFDQVRNNKRFIQVVLALIMVPFALWGVDSYVRDGGATDVATVGGMPISLGEFQQSLREQQERLRPQLGPNASTDVFESPQFRLGVLQDLINQRLLMQVANQSKLRVSDEALIGFISSVPSLQENGKFSRQRYEELVAAQGMSIEMFEMKVRQDLLMQQSMLAVGNAAHTGRIPADRWLAAQLEEREIREMVLRADQFAVGVKPEADVVKRFYEENRARFENPEQVKLEYLVLSRDKLIEQAKVSDDEAKAWYQTNLARYSTPEQRQASHILLRLEKNASDSEVKAAQAKAEQLLAQLKSNPGDFAKLAKEHSQDPGSAGNGGELGTFGRGMMVKPFEDAVYALKVGDLSPVVRSDFGIHLIKLTGIKPERVRPFEDVRAEIIGELKNQHGAKLFAEAAESFSNTVYEQSDSLAPAAEKYRLSVQTSPWMAKGGEISEPFTHPKLKAAIFSEDALKNRRNTEAVDVGANRLVSARVVDYRPAYVEPLEVVAGVIEKALAHEAAVARAAETGRAQLEKLGKGEKIDIAWGTARTVSRLNAPNLSGEARNAIFGAGAQTLPAYVGASIPGGYALYRIEKVSPYDAQAGGDVAVRGEALRQHYAQVVAQEELSGWLASLRQTFPVKINNALLQRRD